MQVIAWFVQISGSFLRHKVLLVATLCCLLFRIYLILLQKNCFSVNYTKNNI